MSSIVKIYHPNLGITRTFLARGIDTEVGSPRILSLPIVGYYDDLTELLAITSYDGRGFSLKVNEDSYMGTAFMTINESKLENIGSAILIFVCDSRKDVLNPITLGSHEDIKLKIINLLSAYSSNSMAFDPLRMALQLFNRIR